MADRRRPSSPGPGCDADARAWFSGHVYEAVRAAGDGTPRAAKRGVAAARSVLVCVALAIAVASSPARADDGVDHAFDLQRPPDLWNMGDPLRRLTLTGFDPGDPQVGLALLAAYAPTPLLLVEELRPESGSHAFDAVELFVASIGIAASSYGFTTSFRRSPDAGLGIESLATAHALAWNLQLALLAAVRLVFGMDTSGDDRIPTFVPFTVDGGAGVVAQWTR